MINKKAALPLMAVVLAGTASAAPVGGVPANAGFINFDPGSPFYAVETTVEPIFQDKNTTIRERAAEYTEMANSNPDAAPNALRALEKVSKSSNKNHSEALNEAYNAVNSAPTPEEAQQGIQTALGAIQQAQQREPKKGIANKVKKGVGDAGEKPQQAVNNMPDGLVS